MRQGQIRVFDGLRITTEHINHFQGSIHSAIQDIRGILGLGRVHSGFEVAATDADTVVVQPGLAFDFQRNRIASDEPKTVQVNFDAGQQQLFVCAKYDQIEDGQTEGHSTLIWDSCSVVLRPTLPVPKDNLVPVAKVTKTKDGTLQIVDLNQEEQDENTEVEIAEKSDSRTTSEPAAAEGVKNTSESSEPAQTRPEPANPPVPMPSNTPNFVFRKLQFRQGVLRLATDPGTENYLSTVLVELLRKKLGSSNNVNAELLFALAKAEVILDFPVSSFTCHVVTSATVNVSKNPNLGAEANYDEFKCQATAHAEVTFNEDQISQFGVSTYHCGANGRQGSLTCPGSELTEEGIAHVRLGTMLQDSGHDTDRAILQNIQLLIKMEKATEGFGVIGQLLWKGGVNGEVIEVLKQQETRFTWEAFIGWKAIGESTMN